MQIDDEPGERHRVTPGVRPLSELTDRAMRLLDRAPAGRRVLLGIAGAPGAGKTTLATALTAALAARRAVVAHVPMDGFHLADAGLDLIGLRDRKGAPETFDAAGYGALLGRIAAGEAVWVPAFERDLEQPIAQAIRVPADARIIVSEGNYLLLPAPEWRAVASWFDEIWFCQLDDEVRRACLISRHIQFGKTPDEARDWVDRLDQANARAVAATAPAADLLIRLPDRDRPESPASGPRRAGTSCHLPGIRVLRPV
ncbi:MAG TPA: nucleoside/nucleotide kinase family protein [Streptosporangiaceae bacterium]|nr:nucleoside/nucleotide kinase family protein [Streptosporangiaceae bacterium]